jgi:hypothetical protein
MVVLYLFSSYSLLNRIISLKVLFSIQGFYSQKETKTFRDIILFNKEYDENRYNTTIKACQLTSDLANLPGGD